MKSGRVFAGVLGVLVVMSAVVVPSAATAAVCVHDRQDLPLPEGVKSAHTEGSSSDDNWIVGAYSTEGAGRALVWENGALREMVPPAYPWHDVYPEAINNSGVVVGRMDVRRSGGALSKAFRYENGVYQTLLTVPGEMATAYGVNDAGDVVGTTWTAAAPSVRRVTMWPRSGGRSSFGEGFPVGIDSQRKIAFTTPGTGWIVDGDTGARIELPGARFPMVLDNDRVLHHDYDGQNWISERDLDGVLIDQHRGGYEPYGRNSSGTVFGELAPNVGGVPSLWTTNSRSPVVADKLPDSLYHADITDDGNLIGTYQADDGAYRPARWTPGPDCG